MQLKAQLDQERPESRSRQRQSRTGLTRIVASSVFDPKLLKIHKDQAITIDNTSGLIIDVRSFHDEHDPFMGKYEYLVDLVDKDGSRPLVVPGFVDTHVHCESGLNKYFLHPIRNTTISSLSARL